MSTCNACQNGCNTGYNSCQNGCNACHTGCNSCQSGCNGWWNQNNWGNFNHWNGCNRNQQHAYEDACPYSIWRHPIHSCPAYYCDAGTGEGATLVIHKIVLEAGCEQSCTPRTFYIRITGPSYPCGETFALRAGSCLELDEPLVISGLEPGQYHIEELHGCAREYFSTITGPVCGHCVTVSASAAPTVITIVSRRHHCRNTCGCS